jgi:hypothetical protein
VDVSFEDDVTVFYLLYDVYFMVGKYKRVSKSSKNQNFNLATGKAGSGPASQSANSQHQRNFISVEKGHIVLRLAMNSPCNPDRAFPQRNRSPGTAPNQPGLRTQQVFIQLI